MKYVYSKSYLYKNILFSKSLQNMKSRINYRKLNEDQLNIFSKRMFTLSTFKQNLQIAIKNGDETGLLKTMLLCITSITESEYSSFLKITKDLRINDNTNTAKITYAYLTEVNESFKECM